MKQVVQSYKTGEVSVVDVPPPAAKSGHVLARNVASLVSAGTERHMLELARKSLVGKALTRDFAPRPTQGHYQWRSKRLKKRR